MMIHNLDCTNKDESCPIDPVVRDDLNKFPWLASQANPEDTIWYSFVTDQGERGDFPTLTFYLELPEGSSVSKYEEANYELVIEDADSKEFPFLTTGVTEDKKKIFGEINKLEGAGGQEKEYYLKVNRKQVLGQEITEAFYYTTLTYFYPHLVKCEVQDDTFGDDDIYSHVEVDSPEGLLDLRYENVHNDPDWAYLAEFDTGSVYGGVPIAWGDPQRQGFPRKFTKWVVINLVEYNYSDINDRLYPGGLFYPEKNWWRIPPLAEDQEKFEGVLLWWAPILPPPFLVPFYNFYGTLSHKPPEKAPSLSN
jgi:hypothetical protein